MTKAGSLVTEGPVGLVANPFKWSDIGPAPLNGRKYTGFTGVKVQPYLSYFT